MSAGDGWYVRNRGRVQGPFSLAQLRDLRDRGQIARFHQLSKDQAGWIQAGSLEDLFPAAPAMPSPAPAPSPAGGPRADPAPPGPGADEPWFYSQGGSAVGPVPFDDLLALARTGKLPAGTLVWHEGMPDWVEAASVEALRGGASAPPRERSPIAFAEAPAASGPTSGLAVAGFAAGLLAMLSGVGMLVVAAILEEAGADENLAGVVFLAMLALCGLAAVAGLAMSGVAIARIGRSEDARRGRGLAIAGLVVSLVSLAGALLMAVVIAVLTARSL